MLEVLSQQTLLKFLHYSGQEATCRAGGREGGLCPSLKVVWTQRAFGELPSLPSVACLLSEGDSKESKSCF